MPFSTPWMKCTKAVGQKEMASSPRQPDVCPIPTTARAATDPCSRTGDRRRQQTPQGVVGVEEEEEVLAVVTVANTSLRGFGRGGCMVAVVPTTAPAVAVLPLPTKQRGRHLRYHAREHASRPTSVQLTIK